MWQICRSYGFYIFSFASQCAIYCEQSIRLWVPLAHNIIPVGCEMLCFRHIFFSLVHHSFSLQNVYTSIRFAYNLILPCRYLQCFVAERKIQLYWNVVERGLADSTLYLVQICSFTSFCLYIFLCKVNGTDEMKWNKWDIRILYRTRNGNFFSPCSLYNWMKQRTNERANKIISHINFMDFFSFALCTGVTRRSRTKIHL